MRISEAQAVLLFQSVRELLVNTSKHAEVDKAEVIMAHADGHLNIQVRDTGLGFDLDATERPNSGIPPNFGLFSIRERMNALGGSFKIQSVSGNRHNGNSDAAIAHKCRAERADDDSMPR